MVSIPSHLLDQISGRTGVQGIGCQCRKQQREPIDLGPPLGDLAEEDVIKEARRALILEAGHGERGDHARISAPVQRQDLYPHPPVVADDVAKPLELVVHHLRPAAIDAFRARNTLVAAVRTQLKGTGLDIRELASELVISYPGHPEHGRIYITYTRGEVSHRRTLWSYLGCVGSPASGGTGPRVSTDAIIATLTGQEDQPT